MAIEWTQGTTSEGQSMLLKRVDGSALNLTGRSPANITLLMKRLGGGLPATFTALTGTISIDDAANGRITYQFSAADVANAGRFLLVTKVDFGNPSGPWYSQATELLIASTST
jgi:hypothetical protein